LSGWLVDNLSWRWTFWLIVPFILTSAVTAWAWLPAAADRPAHRIDLVGLTLLAIASSTLLLVVSWAGITYSWVSAQILSLMLISVLFWILFLLAEARAAEAMLDPQLFRNRIFLTASLAALMSCFGLTAITAYYPLFLQGVQQGSATLSGQVITPFSVLLAFTGVPAGLLLARTRRYKWMYLLGYTVLTVALFGLAAFTSQTPVLWGFVVSTAVGVGLGAIPTINTLVVQHAVPKRLLGAATGGIFFFIMLGRAISPALLGSAMNSSYARSLAPSLPASLAQEADAAAVALIGNPRVLWSPPAMAELERMFHGTGKQGQALFGPIVEAIRASMESALRVVFLIGAVTMLASLLLILTIPEIALDAEVPDRNAVASAMR
jgi:MFS family permease